MSFRPQRAARLLCPNHLLLLCVGVIALPACAATASGTAAEQEKEQGWVRHFAASAETSIAKAEAHADLRWREFKRRMGMEQPRHIAAYRGYGNGEQLWIKGRLLENKPHGGPGEDDGWWDNLKATYERWESDEIAGATLMLTYSDETQHVVTDEEGYYSAAFEVDESFPKTDQVIAQYRAEEQALSATHPVTLLHPDARFVVISDVDDTVIHTGITNLLTSARLTFLHNARTRQPLLGVAELYQALSRGAGDERVNPILYVSNSAWNMYDLLRDFMDLNDLPPGPLLLRDLGLGTDTSRHKVETISRLVDKYAPLPVILIGDSGQHDAEIYAEIAEHHEKRIAAIFIRDVDPDDDSDYDRKVDRILDRYQDRDAIFKRVTHSGEIARALAPLDLLSEQAVARVDAAVSIDLRQETLTEETTPSPLDD